MEFTSAKNLLYSDQFGFRKNHSTESALIKLVDSITEALDSKKSVCSVAIDLNKAFDTVDYQILCSKLFNYGFRGVPLELIKNYLTNISQYVSIDGVISSSKQITVGVPQGSILGPILFLFILMILTMHSQMLTPFYLLMTPLSHL